MKWSKKQAKWVLAAVLFYSGLLNLGIRILRWRRREYPAAILFYHRFQKGEDRSVPPRLSVELFRRQMAHLAGNYDVVSLDRLVEHIGRGTWFENPTVVITMDDGFRDNFELAFPVLREMNMPATVFLTTGFVGTEKAPWVDEIAMAVWRTKMNDLSFPELLGERTIDLSSGEARAKASHLLYERLLDVEHREKEALVARLLEVLCADEEDRCPNGRFMLSWEEIEAMTRHGISLGAHTMTHPVLSQMAFEDAAREILQSKEMIEEVLGIQIRHFAIPNGRDEDFTEDLRQLCKKENFLSVATTNSGRIEPGADPYRLPRVCPPEHIHLFAFDLARLVLFS